MAVHVRVSASRCHSPGDIPPRPRALLDRPGNQEVQLSLFKDYQHNVALYPKFHEYFRKSNVPILAVWGKNDVGFVKEGGEAFRRDSGNVEVRYLDPGHFALETNEGEVAGWILGFLGRYGV